jgi:hypothetical protein
MFAFVSDYGNVWTLHVTSPGKELRNPGMMEQIKNQPINGGALREDNSRMNELTGSLRTSKNLKQDNCRSVIVKSKTGSVTKSLLRVFPGTKYEITFSEARSLKA